MASGPNFRNAAIPRHCQILKRIVPTSPSTGLSRAPSYSGGQPFPRLPTTRLDHIPWGSRSRMYQIRYQLSTYFLLRR